MATQNLTRGGKERNQKKCMSGFSAELDYTDEIGISADIYELAKLPPNALVRACIEVVVASDAATSAAGDIGFAGGAELVSAANLKSTAGTILPATVAQYVSTGATGKTLTFKPTYTGATTVGKFRITLEILEFKKNNGEYMPYSDT